MRWGDVIKPTGDSDIMGMSIDILPTIVEACGAKLPEKMIDGISMMPVLRGKSNKPVQDHYVFFWEYKVEAIRKGKWKYHFPHTYLHIDPTLTGKDGHPGTEQWLKLGESLYNLEKDPSESVNILRKHPLKTLRFRSIGAKAQKEMDKNRRAPEFLNNTK
jgi:arylsulfatase